MTPVLTSAQRRALRARAHPLHPVVMISDAGLGPAMLNEIDRNLSSHELIKIRLFSKVRATREALLRKICDTLSAAPVQHIGRILVVYRPQPADTEANTRKATPRRKPPRRTKRGFQH